MSTKSEWATVIIGGVQFAAGIGLTWYTLQRQHNDSVATREANWFHKVVVDKTIAALHTLLDDEAKHLETSAQKCQQIKLNSAGVNIDDFFRNEIQQFRQRIAPTRRSLINLAYIFDGDLHKQVSEAFEHLEDGVSMWFDKLQRSPESSERLSLIATVADSQKQLLNAFRDFEFVRLPSLHKKSFRA